MAGWRPSLTPARHGPRGVRVASYRVTGDVERVRWSVVRHRRHSVAGADGVLAANAHDEANERRSPCRGWSRWGSGSSGSALSSSTALRWHPVTGSSLSRCGSTTTATQTATRRHVLCSMPGKAGSILETRQQSPPVPASADPARRRRLTVNLTPAERAGLVLGAAALFGLVLPASVTCRSR